MASKKDIEKRRRELKKFMLEKGNGKSKFKDIKNFYRNFKDPNADDLTNPYIYKSLSEDTIRCDLKKIGAKCRKTINNTYSLEDVDRIEKLHLSIKSILINCIVSKPMLTAKSLDIINDNINEKLNIYSIIIISKDKDKNIILSLYSKLMELYSIYDGLINIDALNIEIFDSYIEFKFINKKSAINFYKKIVKIQQFEDVYGFLDDYTMLY